jgi:spermidine/putrescine-binding protein
VYFRTWEDHFIPSQLREIEKELGFQIKTSLAQSDLSSFQELERGVGYDIVSIDGLWVPKFNETGLIEAFTDSTFSTWPEIYSVARNVDFWHEGQKNLAYANGWAPHLLFYNPEKVRVPPNSYGSLTDPMYKNLIVLEKEPNDIMAIAGVATGAAKPYEMTPAEISSAKAYLEELKPNVVSLALAGTAVQRAYEDGGIVSTILGFDLRTEQAGGAPAKPVFPSDGTIGFADAQMLPKETGNRQNSIAFIDANYTPERVAARFLKYAHPYFSESAYKVLIKQGHKELADRLYYNQPDIVFDESKMALVSPPKNQQEYTDAFNEVFGV